MKREARRDGETCRLASAAFVCLRWSALVWVGIGLSVRVRVSVRMCMWCVCEDYSCSFAVFVRSDVSFLTYNCVPFSSTETNRLVYHVKDGLHSSHGGYSTASAGHVQQGKQGKQAAKGPGYYRYYRMNFRRRVDDTSWNNKKFIVPEVVFNDRNDATNGWHHAPRTGPRGSMNAAGVEASSPAPRGRLPAACGRVSTWASHFAWPKAVAATDLELAAIIAPPTWRLLFRQVRGEREMKNARDVVCCCVTHVICDLVRMICVLLCCVVVLLCAVLRSSCGVRVVNLAASYSTLG